MEVGRVRVTTVPARRTWALRFLAGRYQGGVVPLEEGRELLVGRLRDAGLVLPDELTSRRHARVGWEAGQPVVEDLGSTNGTFVNGERITRRLLREGDRLLVGGNILKLVTEVRPAALDADTLPGLETVTETPDAPGRRSAIQGRLDEVGLPDVLQLFATSRKSGVLRVRRGDGRAEVHLDGGRVTRAFLEGRDGLPPVEVFMELVQWREGTFELLQPSLDPVTGSGPILDEPVESLLIDAFRRIDEITRG